DVETLLGEVRQWYTQSKVLAPQSTALIVFNLHDLNQTVTDASAPAVSPSLTDALGARSAGVFTPTMLSEFRKRAGAESDPYHPAASEAWPNGVTLINGGTPYLLAFGVNRLRPQSGYDVAVDAGTIFASAEVGGTVDTVVTTEGVSEPVNCAVPAAGVAMNGTGFDLGDSRYTAGQNTTTPAARVVSWSWAYVVDTPAKPFTPALVSQLMGCGFDVMFRDTVVLGNQTDLLNATVWSWEVGQPDGTAGADCAVVNGASGRW
ncbi:hypothetical protein HK104_007921, partial [Borealophlyctis nickersoniae]